MRRLYYSLVAGAVASLLASPHAAGDTLTGLGDTLALISTMTGSVANDFIGSDNFGRGVLVLADGDYVVISSSWSAARGAVTRCNAATGCPGQKIFSNK